MENLCISVILCTLIICVTVYYVKKLKHEPWVKDNDKLVEKMKSLQENEQLYQSIIKDAIGITELKQEINKLNVILTRLYNDYYNNHKFENN